MGQTDELPGYSQAILLGESPNSQKFKKEVPKEGDYLFHSL